MSRKHRFVTTTQKAKDLAVHHNEVVLESCWNPYQRWLSDSQSGSSSSAASEDDQREMSGRGERIRTSGLYVPNVALYQAKLHPEVKLEIVAKLRLAIP